MSDSFDSMNNVNWTDVLVLAVVFMVFSNLFLDHFAKAKAPINEAKVIPNQMVDEK